MDEHITILAIDDDITIRTLIESTLSRKGFKVYTADNGADGLDIAKNEDIDVILLDWMMPEMDGMQVLAELKRDSKTMFIPVFMLTSKEDSKDLEMATSRGAVDYIIKPFNLYEVPSMVTSYLEKNHVAHHSHKNGFFSRLFAMSH